MKNRLGLPLPFVEFALEADSKHTFEPHVYSVTELLNPTRKIALCRIHKGEIEYDVSDSIPALFGTAVHKVLESMSEGKRSEVSVGATFGDCRVTGRIDLVDGDTIVDYKTCSVAKVQKSDYADWLDQCTAYAYLLWKTTGEVCRRIRVYAIMKDWSKIKAASAPGYPQSAVQVVEATIEDSDYDRIERFLKGKVAEVEEAIATGILPECSDEEKWKTPDKWAVYKKIGDKRAMCVCDSMSEVYDTVKDKCGGTGMVEHRPGECIRCKHYCECAVYCDGQKGGNE